MNNVNSSYNEDNNEIESKFKSIFLFNAVHDVMQTMAGISMSEVKITDSKEIHITDACVSGVYFMNGPKNAMLIVSMPTAEAYTMVSRFSGIPVSELGADTICDAINELTNMISGKIKSQLASVGYEYINSHCFSIYGPKYLILHKSKLKNIAKKYKAENTELVLRILFV
ncbi:MAG: hypothetical protein CVU90_09225 [Firmicutes bacterium HGW-Firmicutes-15]|nr:MAG: hypothetical protein CVU90_09225 [Firmicutes bacterium HGW-Firmicutes-15]